MFIKYFGPSMQVYVCLDGRAIVSHKKDEVLEYSETAGKEILASAKRQRFIEVIAVANDDSPLQLQTIANLKQMLDDKGLPYGAKAKKEELILLLEENQPPAETA